MSRCRSCSAPIVWTKTANGKAFPLQAEDMGGWEAPIVSPVGNVKPTGQRLPDRYGGTVMVVEVVAPGEGKYVGHWAECPDSKDWKRG